MPGSVVHACVVVCAFLLLEQLFGLGMAVVAGCLWATSPYLVAYSRVLHLDATLTDTVMLSLLLLVCACTPPHQSAQPGRRVQYGYLVGSGCCAGLALLTKGPALILLPYAGLAMFGLAIAQERLPGQQIDRSTLPHVIRASFQALPGILLRYLGWLGSALLVVVVCWPALWVSPGAAIARYVGEITSNGGRPNGDGQFFLGQAVADPGWLFYPLADLFRTTPAMLIGLLGAIGIILVGLARRRIRLATQPAMVVLIGFVVFWTAVMTLGPKKFDRYVLPTWPALIILAAAGLFMLIEHAPRRSRGWIWSALLLTELLQLGWYQPYYLSYYNPMLGGGAVAQNLFLVGWGEGMDQVGAYLRARPDIQYGPVLSALGQTLQPFVPVDVRDVADFGSLPANYAVVYRESIQRAANPALYAQLQTTVPLHTVTIHGIDYAQIYQLPRPFAQPLDARFGDALQLRGITLEQAPNHLTLTPAWDVRAHPGAEYHMFVHLLDAHGTRITQIDLAPGGGAAAPTNTWEPGQQIAVPMPLPLPTNLPPGSYRLVIGIYDVATGARLPLVGGTRADPALAGAEALLVATIERR
jgi:4-amino-4-deoxy-L-arabinose transferase-like glycosyltransferase